MLQAVLEAEVDEFLDRIRGARGGTRPGYRDGHEEERPITYGSHPISVRRPRVRESAERFTSQVLPPYRRRFEELDKTLHELWIQGLSTRDFEPSLRALLGEQTPLSPSTISRVNKQFYDEYGAWCQRPIANEFVYLWADGVYLGAGPAGERRVMLAVMGVDNNGDKAMLAIEDAFAESEESWTPLQTRGYRLALLVADGDAGIWSAFGKVFPGAQQQRCWLHKLRNVLDKVPERIESAVQDRLRAIMHADNRVLAESLIESLARRLERDYSKAATCVRDDTGRMFAYYVISGRALASHAHNEHLRVPLRSGPSAHQRLQAPTKRDIGNVFGLCVARSTEFTLAALQRLRTA